MTNIETKETPQAIQGFFGKYRPLSNYDLTPFKIKGVVFKSGEHAFHYFKIVDEEWREKILNAETPSDAKRLGRKCHMRADWDIVKVDYIKYGRNCRNLSLWRIYKPKSVSYVLRSRNFITLSMRDSR